MATEPPGHRAGFFTLRVLLYLLPGLAAAVGAFLTLLTAGRVTATLAGLTAAGVVLGFGVPPIVDWLHGRYVRQMSRVQVAARRRQKWAEAATAQIRDHFGPRGRGTLPSSMRSGSYFTGRVRVLSELAGWLGDASDARARVVTGAPGSGKSAVLGRLIWLADPQMRSEHGDARAVGALPETAPLIGAISVAVHARGRMVDEVATEVAHALDIHEPGAAGLIAALRESWQPRAVGILVDAVDEAADPYRLIVELLEPLASASDRTKIRLLAGTRRGGDDGLLRLFGASAVVLDLDSPANLGAQDIEQYVCRTLTAEEDPQVATPYRNRLELAAPVARAVAARAGKSFLVAQLSALSLTAADDPVDTTTVDWAERFPSTVGAAMERYLREVRPGGRWLRDLLMALAWSQGDGLQDPGIWAAAATATGTGEYSERDVARLLLDTSAVDLLHRTVRGEQISYRLFHEALSEHLRRESSHYLPAAETQRRLADVLVGHVPRTPGGSRDWSRADGYTRTYLPVHAAQGRVLDTLLDDAGFLATAEPGRLLAALPQASTDRGRQTAQTVERVGQQLLRAPAGEQACYLEMAARMAGDDRLAKDLAQFASRRPWSVAWARWEPLDQGRLLGHHNDYVIAVSAVATGRGPMVVSASAWAIRAWSLAEGSPVASGLREPSSPIWDMVAFADAGETVVLTLHENGELRRTTLGAGTPPQTLARDLTVNGLWLVSHSGHHAVVAKTRDRMVEALSVVDGRPVGLPAISIGEDPVLTAASVGQRMLVAVATADQTSDAGRTDVVIWDLNTGAMLGPPLRPEQHFPDRDPMPVRAAAISERGGRPIMLAGSMGGGPVSLWDPIRARPIGEPRYGLAVFSVLIASAHDGELQCWGDTHGNLHLRSGDDGAVRRIAAHDSGIHVIAACDLDGVTLLVTGGRDGAVRVWDPAAARPAGPQTGTRGLVVVPPAGSGSALIAAIREDGTGQLLDAASGQILARLTPSPDAHLDHIALLPGTTPAIVTVDSRNRVAVWRPPEDQPEFTWQLPVGVEVSNIAVANSDHPALLTAQADGQLGFFDTASGQPIRSPLTCHATIFKVTASPEQAGGSMRFATANWHEPYEVSLWTISGGKVARRSLPIRPEPDLGHYSIGALAFACLDNRCIIAGVGSYSSLRLWDADDGSLLAHARLEETHHMVLEDVDIGKVAGRPLILCGGYTCSLALWALDTRDIHHLRVGSPLWITKSLPGDRAVVAGSRGIMTFQLGAHLPGRPSGDGEPTPRQ